MINNNHSFAHHYKWRRKTEWALIYNKFLFKFIIMDFCILFLIKHKLAIQNLHRFLTFNIAVCCLRKIQMIITMLSNIVDWLVRDVLFNSMNHLPHEYFDMIEESNDIWHIFVQEENIFILKTNIFITPLCMQYHNMYIYNYLSYLKHYTTSWYNMSDNAVNINHMKVTTWTYKTKRNNTTFNIYNIRNNHDRNRK